MDPLTGLRSDADLAEPREAADWLRGHGVTLAAVTLIAIQLLWMGDLLAHSYFRQDDYSYLYRGLDSGFGWKYLMWEDAGHLQPLGMALAWVLARVSLYNWPLTCVITLLLLAGVCFAMLRTLRTLFGNRPGDPGPARGVPVQPAAAGRGFLVVARPSTSSRWSSGMLMAVDAHVRDVRGGQTRERGRRGRVAAPRRDRIGQGAVVPLLLFGLTAAFLVAGPLKASVVAAVARYWRLWLGYAVIVAAWGAAVYLSQLPGSTVKPDSASDVLNFVSTFTGTTLLPATLGGPWRWSAAGWTTFPAPPAALQQLAWAVAVVVVVVSAAPCACARGGPGRSWPPGSPAADIVPVVLGRLANPAGEPGGRADAVPDGRGARAGPVHRAGLPAGDGEPSAIRFRLPSARPAVLLALGVYLVGSYWSLQAFESLNSAAARAARSYIATARAAVADAPRGTLIVDGPTPALVMDPGVFGLFGNTSMVVGAIARGEPARHLSWTGSPQGVTGRLMIFNDLGQLLPVTMAGPFSWPPPPAQSCWNVTTAATRIPLTGPLYRWPWTARVNYFGTASVLEFRLGGNWTQVTLPAGTHTAYIPVTGQGNEVSVRLAQPGPALCITGMRVGSLNPGPASQAIPAGAGPA